MILHLSNMNSSQPLFTIATITYNSSQWVRQAIESVLAASFADFEYLIADDFSTDNTWNIINEYKDARIIAWQNDANIGEYPNRNKILEKAHGKYILYVDGDDILYHHTLRNLKEYLDYYTDVVSIWGVAVDKVSFVSLPVCLSPEEITRWIYLANIWIAQLGLAETVFQTEALKKSGGFPTHLISGDTYTKKRIALEGNTLLVPMGFMYWRNSPGQASSKMLKSYNGFINNVQIERGILAILQQKNFKIPLEKVKQNIAVRDIKLLFKHTFLKGKFKDGITLFLKLGFQFRSLKYLFIKGDYQYKKQLAESSIQDNFHCRK